MKLFRWECLVFVVASFILSWNLWNVGIASGSIDPVLHLGAQDEATYTREAITMARDGGWMTPTFLGRWVFEKPPLLMWLSAASMKLLGVGRIQARLPAIFAGALLCTMLFAMVRSQRSLPAAVAAAAMSVSSQILFIMSRHNMTDILLAAAGLCAFAILLRDPDLRAPGTLLGFVLAAAAGLMAKSIAGLLVLAVTCVVVGLGRRQWARVSLAAALSILLASPWFVYNYLLHRDWFLADMGFQIITIGTATRQTAPGNHLWFYISRILASDLLPLLFALTALPALSRAVRRREPAGQLAAAYFVVYFAALMIFRFHSEQYLCWFVPSLMLIGALYSPLLNGRAALAATAVIALGFLVKLANPDAAFGLSAGSDSTLAAAPVLSHYCGEHRAADLYILGVDDEFYSAALPLPRVHYGWLDPAGTVALEHPHLAYLGIMIPAAELPQLDRQLPKYRDRLRAWGLDSTRPVATGLPAQDVSELLRVLHDHPESDFLVARTILPEPGDTPSHRVVFTGNDFALLESKLPVSSVSAAWSCEM